MHQLTDACVSIIDNYSFGLVYVHNLAERSINEITFGLPKHFSIYGIPTQMGYLDFNYDC